MVFLCHVLMFEMALFYSIALILVSIVSITSLLNEHFLLLKRLVKWTKFYLSHKNHCRKNIKCDSCAKVSFFQIDKIAALLTSCTNKCCMTGMTQNVGH